MKKFLDEWLSYIIIIVIVIIVRTYFFTPVVVRGSSMENTLFNGQVLLLNKINYRFNDIKRFDIIVIKEDKNLIIKRVIGIPGDYVKYEDNVLYVNGKEISKDYAYTNTNDFDLEDICDINDTKCDGKIPHDMYLALGDNRIVSADSRARGLFSKKQILGKTTIRLWPFNKFGKIE